MLQPGKLPTVEPMTRTTVGQLPGAAERSHEIDLELARRHSGDSPGLRGGCDRSEPGVRMVTLLLNCSKSIQIVATIVKAVLGRARTSRVLVQ